jgi:predicted transcriptional regulator of viral defense system
MKVPRKRIRKGAVVLSDRAVDFLREAGVARSRDLVARGVTRATLQRLVARGAIERIGRGLYTLKGTDLGEKQSLVEAALIVPAGVLCLLSALQFHGMTTQNPSEVWVAIDHKSRSPAGDRGVPLRVVRLSGAARDHGVVEHRIGGVTLKVYGAAKTVADCFKFRHLIGQDVAMEALRDCLRYRRATVDEIWTAARVDRVANLIRSYLEALT